MPGEPCHPDFSIAGHIMTTETAAALAPIVGLDVVGRGLYLRPRSPYQLTRLLFPHTNIRSFKSKETGECYGVPEGYEVNDSPPMPAHQALNQLMIEESFDRFESQLKLDASLAVGNSLFSIDASASQAKQLRTSEDAYYALRSSFIPLWSVYLTDTTNVPADTFDLSDVPAPFDHDARKKYDAFFDRYGTHFVKRAWIGGKANLAFTVLKSSSMSKTEIQAGIKASFGTSARGGANSSLQEAKEKLQSNAECTVWGKGGHELNLAALSSFDEVRYNEWLATIKDNPQVIELEVGGIWTLLRDREKAAALLDAYKAATTFKPLSAVFDFDGKLFFLRGSRFTVYNIERAQSTQPMKLFEQWSFLAGLGFDRIDAAFRVGRVRSQAGEDLSRKFYVFRKNQYLRVDYDKLAIDEGYPKKISEGFPGVTFERVDAVFTPGNGEVYFFSGDQYIRFNVANNRADAGYPDSIKKRWVGLTFDRIDAAIYWGNGKAYFFKDDEHIRYDLATYRADPGYPKAIIGSYVEDWKFFD